MKKIILILITILMTACNSQNEIKINANLTSEITNNPKLTYYSKATITMVGDVLIHDRLLEYAKKDDGSYDFSDFFKEVTPEIEASDLALVNQETLVGGIELGLSGYPMFNAPFELAQADKEAGFDVICQANNHALDRGTTGIENDIANFEGLGLDVVGIHDSESDEAVLINKINNINIAIVNYTYGTNGLTPKYDYLVDYIDRDQIKLDVEEAKTESDFVIVVLHWGDEYSLKANNTQKDLAEYLNELKVDLVLGSHPHVIEPIEVLDNDNYQTLVFYSLGNFINATNGSGDVADRMLGGLANIEIEKDINGTRIVDYEMKGLVSHLDLDGLTTTYYLDNYTQQQAAENEIIKQDSSFSLQYLQDTYNKVIN